ncbi:MAG: branched-chain-amino-acid transaminase [Planctomycetes bacterium]|nr:branched-chain-amino-acid transaminase [Planctomycetota bacterium]
MKVWLDGRLVEKQDAKLTVFDHGTLYGDGVFEGIRIYSGKIFQIQAHIDRFFESAGAIRLKIPYDKRQVRQFLYETVKANDKSDGYIRLVVTRGEGTLGLNPNKCPRPSLFIIVDDIELYPREMYEKGMPVIIAKTVRTSPRMLNPAIKCLNYLNNSLAKIECVDAGVGEAIMLNEHGQICEATGDNVFIVKNGVVITPPSEAGVLRGVTRGVVMKLAGRLGIKAIEMPVGPEELAAADECFLTGTAAEVVPVTKVDGRPVGHGHVGAITKKLIKAFHEFTRSHEAE